MTKAERIFNDTRFDCLQHIKDWPDAEDGGFNRLTYKDNECISQRTINDIRKILTSKQRLLETDRKLGVSTPERLNRESRVLKMVEMTLNNSERSINEWK